MNDVFTKYPVINENIVVRVFPNDGISFYLKDTRKAITVSFDYWQIYKKFEGNKNLFQIYKELSKDWEIDKDELEKFVIDSLGRKFINLLDVPTRHKILTSGDTKTFYPTTISIELTNKCNIRCIYCYGSYEPQNQELLDFEKLKEIFSFFQSNGAMLLELTGGEPLLYPRFIEACKLALEYFPAFTLLSNGTLFKEEHFDIIKKNIGRINLQISIDGISDETNNQGRGVPNTWERTLYTIKRLIDMNANLKIVYMLTKGNIQELNAACELMRHLGVKKKFIISPAINIGRGRHSDCSIMMNNMFLDIEYVNFMKDLDRNYPDVIYTIQKDVENSKYISKDEQKNCGAGWRMINISANGDVKACHLLGENGKIGNIFKDNYKSIFTSDKAVNFYQKFQKKIVDERCDSCTYKLICVKCMFRIFEINKLLISQGKDICPVAKSNKMDAYLNFV